MKIESIETPALIVEKELMESNQRILERMISESGLNLFPHYKSHKCAELARWQMSRGAAGITCAKLGEAEDLAAARIPRIVLANQVVQTEKLPKLAQVAAQCDLTVCADDPDNVRQLEQALAGYSASRQEPVQLRVLVEYEVGMRRCGVDTSEECLALARLISAQPHLRFDGIQAYAGHISHEKDPVRRRSELLRIEEKVRLLKEFLEKNGVPVANVCGGSTGYAAEKPRQSVYTQMQAGSYLFMDQTYQGLKLAFQQALFVLTTVVSVRPDHIVVDTGLKSLTMDQDAPCFAAYPDAVLDFSEEHTSLRIPGAGHSLGEKLRCVPGHCCTTVNLYDKMYFVEGTEVTDIRPVTSRGRSQ